MTKINRIAPNGLVMSTCAQTAFNEHTDAMDEDGNWWADINATSIETVDYEETVQDESSAYSIITFSGIKPEIKVGGSYKTFTVDFYGDGAPVAPFGGTWSVLKDGVDIISDPDLIATLDSTSSSALKDNQIKIKFLGNDSYIKTVLTVKYVCGTIESSVDVEVRGL